MGETITTSSFINYYEEIKANSEKQWRNYAEFVAKLSPQTRESIEHRLVDMGLFICWKTGCLKYAPNFTPQCPYVEIGFIRHGKTFGNTEPRIFQGQIDYPENQLNEIGKQEALRAADEVEQQIKMGWIPDLILISPLNRCKETAAAFCKNHPDLKVEICDQLKEISFGSWETKRLINLGNDSIAHLFYMFHNAIVKSDKPHIRLDNNQSIDSESFIDVIFRIGEFLLYLKKHPLLFPEGCLQQKRRVLIYSHSIVGAALKILTGNGNVVDGLLVFDGKYLIPNATFIKLLPKII